MYFLLLSKASQHAHRAALGGGLGVNAAPSRISTDNRTTTVSYHITQLEKKTQVQNNMVQKRKVELMQCGSPTHHRAKGGGQAKAKTSGGEVVR